MLLLVIVVAALLIGGSVRTVDYGKVKNIARADGVTGQLRVALMEYQVSGPIDIEIISGVRTEEEQARLYAQGRSTPGEIVTYAAHAVDTAHGRGGAIDFAVLVGGVQTYGSDARHLYLQVAEWFEARGFVSGIRWTKEFPPDGDMGHINVSNWKALAMRLS